MVIITTIALSLAAAVSAVALPNPQTTGNSGGQPYATENTLTLYAAASFNLNGTGVSHCHWPTSSLSIEADRCYNMSTGGVTVGRVAEGNCVLQLFYNSDACLGDSRAHSIEPGSGDSGCYRPLWGEGHLWQAGSGIWTCG